MLHSDALEARMKELLVSFDGLQYVYGGFHYDNLPDAMAYASLMRARPRQLHKSTSVAAPRNFSPPTEAQRTLMSVLGIELIDHSFRFEGFRYDQLADAVADAKRARAAVCRSDPA